MDGFLPTTALTLASVPDWALFPGILLAAWIALSALIQWGAARSAALGRGEAPACFDPNTHPAGTGDSIHVAFLGDLQRGVVEVPGPLARIARDKSVDLIVSSGDFVSHGEAPYYGLLLAAFARAGGKTPIRVVPGNHDLWPRRSKDDDIGGALFEEHFGPRHWHLRAGPVLIVGIDTGADWQMEAQLPWMRTLLADNPNTPWICVSHRAPYDFDNPERPLREDLRDLAAFVDQHPPQLFISGHLHAYHDEVVNGVRYIVNAHGGDVHGLALRREDFELLHVRMDAASGLRAEPAPYERKRSLATAVDQLAVRMWSDRRKPLGAVLAWPAGIVLRMIGRYIPAVKLPVERRIPSREVLHTRRRAFAEARESKGANS
jgi:predicted phosphodiesterase